MAEARRLCPQAIVVPPRMDAYAEVSRAVPRHPRRASRRWSSRSRSTRRSSTSAAPSGCSAPPPEVGARHQAARARRARADRVGRRARRSSSWPRSPATSASPTGWWSCPADETRAFLAPLPIERLFGVGPKTAADAARARPRRRSADRAPPDRGADGAARRDARGRRCRRCARGEDARHVEPDRAPVSIGAEETFEHDLVDGPVLRRRIDRAGRARRRAAATQRTGGALRGAQAQGSGVPRHDAAAHAAGADRRRARDRPGGARAARRGDAARARRAAVGRLGDGVSPADAPRQLTLDEPERARGERLRRDARRASAIASATTSVGARRADCPTTTESEHGRRRRRTTRRQDATAADSDAEKDGRQVGEGTRSPRARSTPDETVEARPLHHEVPHASCRAS